MEPDAAEAREHQEEVRETKGTLLDLFIGEGPLVALVGAVLAALGFELKRRRRRSNAVVTTSDNGRGRLYLTHDAGRTWNPVRF